MRSPSENMAMIRADDMTAAANAFAEAHRPEPILLIGSQPRSDAQEESDLDILVIESEVQDRAGEMVRLRRVSPPCAFWWMPWSFRPMKSRVGAIRLAAAWTGSCRRRG